MYAAIHSHPSVRKIYQDYLVRSGVLEEKDLAEFEDEVQKRHRAVLDQVRNAESPSVELRDEAQEEAWEAQIEPVSESTLRDLQDRQLNWPEEFQPMDKLRGILERRRDMVEGKFPIDFATAEALALASLLTSGRRVRFAGQDTQRGTFSQRHAVLHDEATGETWTPLANLADDQASISIYNSFLSEEAALGFEYGYSLIMDDALIAWEAQFGDFCNGAQIQIGPVLGGGAKPSGQRRRT